MPQRLTMDGIKQLYPEDRWIHVLPAVTKFMGTDSPIWGLDVTEVFIDPSSPSAVYDNKGKDALTKISLDRLAAAAGLNITTRRTDDRADRELCAFEATAMLRLPGGECIARTATREWDGRDAAERVMIECENHVNKQPGAQSLTPEQFDAAAKRRFREEMLREREISRAKTETKAVNRAIAMVLGIPRSFPRGVLKETGFAVVKYVLVPDMSDPVVKQAVIAAGVSAHTQLYAGPPPGGQRALPQSTALRQIADATEADYQDASDTAGLESVVGDGTEPAPTRAAQETQGTRDAQALLGEAPAEVRPDGRSAPGWADCEPYLPDIQRLLTECTHPKIAELKVKYLNAYKAKDVAKVTEIYNWLLDRQITNPGGK